MGQFLFDTVHHLMANFCIETNLFFSSPYISQRNVATTQGKKVQTKFKCSICHSVVNSIEEMKTHVEKVHGLKLKLRVVNSNDPELSKLQQQQVCVMFVTYLIS